MTIPNPDLQEDAENLARRRSNQTQSILQKVTKPFRQAQGPEPVEGETKGAAENAALFSLLPSVQNR
jgi:hypothetical protein